MYFFLEMILKKYVYVTLSVCAVPEEAKNDIQSTRAGGRGGYELPSVDT